MALAGAASLMLLNEVQVGPAWVHWTISVVALAAGLGVLIVADLNWERAVAAAEADGIVVGPDAPPGAGGQGNDLAQARSERTSEI